MVLKKCVVCGKEFDAIKKAKTCSDKCSKILDREYQNEYRKKYRREYQREYQRKYRIEHYEKNNDKGRWYRANAPLDKWGTGSLVEHAKRDESGNIDFTHELNLIRKEKRILGLNID